MDSIIGTIRDAEMFLREARSKPFRTTIVVMLLVVIFCGGAFLESFFKTFGEHGAKVTIEVLESGAIGRLAPSRITPAIYRVSVINESAEVSDEEAKKVVGALQRQLQNDFAPIWGVSAELVFVPKGGKPNDRSWWLTILDESDYLGMLGYHIVNDKGLPMGKVFVRSTRRAGKVWSFIASIELLGMLEDPRLNVAVFVPSPDGTSTSLWAYEITNPCGDEAYPDKKTGVLVADFVTPAWFDSTAKRPDSKFDFSAKIHQPFGLLPGGRAATYDIKPAISWTFKWGHASDP